MPPTNPGNLSLKPTPEADDGVGCTDSSSSGHQRLARVADLGAAPSMIAAPNPTPAVADTVRATRASDERFWRCDNPMCRTILGVIDADGITIRQGSRRGVGRPRIIHVPSGRVEQECYKCGTPNVRTSPVHPAESPVS